MLHPGQPTIETPRAPAAAGDGMLDLDQARELIGGRMGTVSRRTLQRWTRPPGVDEAPRPVLACARPKRGVWWFRASDIEAWLSALVDVQSPPAPAPAAAAPGGRGPALDHLHDRIDRPRQPRRRLRAATSDRGHLPDR